MSNPTSPFAPGPVFLLESPSVTDLAEEQSEGPVIERLLKLLDVRFCSRKVETVEEFRLAARLLRQGLDDGRQPFTTLVVSAHGEPTGIHLTDGSCLHWLDFFGAFGDAITELHVIFSSCSVMKDRVLRNYMQNAEGPAPWHAIGYLEPVTWADSALATGLLVRSLTRTTSVHEIANVLVAIDEILGFDVQSINSINGKTGALRGRTLAFQHTTEGEGARMTLADAMDLHRAVSSYCEQGMDPIEALRALSDDLTHDPKKVLEALGLLPITEVRPSE